VGVAAMLMNEGMMIEIDAVDVIEKEFVAEDCCPHHRHGQWSRKTTVDPPTEQNVAAIVDGVAIARATV
jgi:hypothetical protein